MFRILILATLFTLPALAADTIVVSSGERQTAVVELYTSEGCSSCPPADRWLSRLVKRPGDKMDVLALSFHVDYWDYLGWKDRFSSRDYTNRQRQLGANNLQRSIYTPEFFVNGKEARGTNKVLQQIQQSNQVKAPLELRLEVSRIDASLHLQLTAEGDREATGQIHHRYLVYEDNLSTEVKRGENSGATLEHQRVVRYLSQAKNLRTDNRHQVPILPDWNRANIGVAVIVSSPGNLDYLQAVYTPVASLLARP